MMVVIRERSCWLWRLQSLCIIGAFACGLSAQRVGSSCINKVAMLSVADSSSVMESVLPRFRESYWVVWTNLLYDALCVPNVGVEYQMERSWSVAAHWMYTWLKNDAKHRYWRIYGGEVSLNRWLGRKGTDAHFSGHHLGVYGQLLTYDIEWGSRGYLGDKWSYGGGVVYGYAIPLKRRLNLDFSVHVGYLGGKCKEYLPVDGHYVWQKTRQLHWIGPTQLAVNLVWLLGRENTNGVMGKKRLESKPLGGRMQ